MTLNQFIAWVEENRDKLTGDENLAVFAKGGLGSAGKQIKSATIGFDWDRGNILLHPENKLELSKS